jgi:hypothetical protein
MVTGSGVFFGHRRLSIVSRCPKKTPDPFSAYNQPSENVDLASQRPDD